jgi:hypothetical protein
VPALIPVTTPPATLAEELLLDQTPPVAGSVSVIVDPTQTLDGPDIVPAVRNNPMATILVAENEPHPLVTV